MRFAKAQPKTPAKCSFGEEPLSATVAKVRTVGSCLEQQVPMAAPHTEGWPGPEENKFKFEQADWNPTKKTNSYRK